MNPDILMLANALQRDPQYIHVGYRMYNIVLRWRGEGSVGVPAGSPPASELRTQPLCRKSAQVSLNTVPLIALIPYSCVTFQACCRSAPLSVADSADHAPHGSQ